MTLLDLLKVYQCFAINDMPEWVIDCLMNLYPELFKYATKIPKREDKEIFCARFADGKCASFYSRRYIIGSKYVDGMPVECLVDYRELAEFGGVVDESLEIDFCDIL